MFAERMYTIMSVSAARRDLVPDLLLKLVILPQQQFRSLAHRSPPFTARSNATADASSAELSYHSSSASPPLSVSTYYFRFGPSSDAL